MDVTVELDEDVVATLARRAETNGFDSTEAYCKMVLSVAAEELRTELQSDENLEERLQDLGYLN